MSQPAITAKVAHAYKPSAEMGKYSDIFDLFESSHSIARKCPPAVVHLFNMKAFNLFEDRAFFDQCNDT